MGGALVRGPWPLGPMGSPMPKSIWELSNRRGFRGEDSDTIMWFLVVEPLYGASYDPTNPFFNVPAAFL